MYKELIKKVKDTFESIEGIRLVFTKPREGAIKEYPAVEIAPSGSQNTFETQSENMRTVTFDIFAEISAENIDSDLLYNDVLPSFIDSIYEKFNTDWQDNIDGHMIWWVLNDSKWQITEEEKGRVASVPMTLTVRFLESI
jgi:hypothetical protein